MQASVQVTVETSESRLQNTEMLAQQDCLSCCAHPHEQSRQTLLLGLGNFCTGLSSDSDHLFAMCESVCVSGTREEKVLV